MSLFQQRLVAIIPWVRLEIEPKNFALQAETFIQEYASKLIDIC